MFPLRKIHVHDSLPLGVSPLERFTYTPRGKHQGGDCRVRTSFQGGNTKGETVVYVNLSKGNMGVSRDYRVRESFQKETWVSAETIVYVNLSLRGGSITIGLLQQSVSRQI